MFISTLPRRFATLLAIIAIIATSGSGASANIVLDASDITATGVFALNGDNAATNDGTVTTGVTGAFAARERVNVGQTDRRIQSFFTFDISAITPAKVQDPAFSATFETTLVSQLNTLTVPANLAALNVAEFTGGTFAYDASLLGTGVQLIPSISQATLPAPASGDISSIISGAVNSGATSVDLAVFIPTNNNQGGGFDSPTITITHSEVVPEPSSLALLGLGVVGLVIRRRR